MAEVKTVKILIPSEDGKIDIISKAKNLVSAISEMQTRGFDRILR